MKPTQVLVVAAAFVALVMTGQPVQPSEMDSQIERTARNLYVFKTYLKGDDITIRSKDGVVFLTGTVSEETRGLLAQETVASLSGVRSVDNRLEVKGDRPAENSDGWIGARVKTVLFFHRGTGGIDVEVSVSNGVVTLRGVALNHAQRQLTAEYAKDVEGVKDVKNEMTVASTPKTEKATVGERIDDASITSQVKISLLFHSSTRVLKTQVDTDKGVVTLSGMARSAAEKDLVTKLVTDINGVTMVNNRMTIEASKAR